MTVFSRDRVSSLIRWVWPLMYRDTVVRETPAAAAMSLMVTLRLTLEAMAVSSSLYGQDGPPRGAVAPAGKRGVSPGGSW